MIEKRKILVIDPDIRAFRIYLSTLNHQSYRVDYCSAIGEAIDMIQKAKFDAVIMDVDLPKMKGYEAVKIIHILDPGVPIIMTAAENSKTLEERIRKEKIFYYYIKSFDKKELLQVVENAVKHHRFVQKVEGS